MFGSSLPALCGEGLHSDDHLYETFGLSGIMTNRGRLRKRALIIIAFLFISTIIGTIFLFHTEQQPISSAESVMTHIRVQNVSLTDYNAPAIQGAMQSNGTALYIPATTEGNLGFQVVMPVSLALAPSNPQIETYLNGELISGCQGVVSLQAIRGSALEVMGCLAPVTPLNSGNNVTILVYSQTGHSGSGMYKYHSIVITTQAA